MGNVVTFVGAAHSGTKVVRMNQVYATGPAKSTKVYPGDVIDAEVWAYYESASGYGTSSPAATTIITAVAAAFGGVSGAGGESGAIFDGVNSGYGAFGLGGNQGDDVPAAYLNYILFDKNYKLLDMGWQAVTSASSWAQAKVEFSDISIKEEGYIFVYLSYENESNNYVYFDDLRVTHTKSNVIQYNEYYAFGLQTASSWTREESKNDYLYNAGSELNSTTGFYEMFHRGYDPVLGRMLQVDPYAHAFASLAPYNYAGNNPISMNDPSGGYMRPNPEAGGNGEYEFFNSIIGHINYSDWNAQNRSAEWNFGLMSQSGFESFYGVDLSTDAGRWAVAQSMAITPGEGDINIIANNLGFQGASVDGNNAWFIVNLVRAVYMGGIEAENQIMMGEYGAINVSLGITRDDLLSAALSTEDDLWNSASNYMTGIGMTVDGAAYSLGRSLDKRLAYEFTKAGYEGYKVKTPSVNFRTPFGAVRASTGFVKGAANILKTGGAVLGVAGLGMTGYEIYKGEKSFIGEGGLDLIMGGIAFVPGGGWIVSGLYFGGKWALEATGNDFWNKP